MATRTQQRASNGSYSNLLQALRPADAVAPAPKRRKLGHSRSANATNTLQNGSTVSAASDEGTITNIEDPVDDIQGSADEVEDESDVSAEVEDISDDEQQSLDPFEQHFSAPTTANIQGIIASSLKSKGQLISTPDDPGLRKTWMPFNDSQTPPTPLQKSTDLHLKQRLTVKAPNLVKSLEAPERHIAGAIFGYKDVLVGNRTVGNSSNLRDICVLHALNHSLKTRDRILKNTAKLAQNGDTDLEARDQGFTRPKILFLLPTKQSCARFIDSIVKFSEPEQQENKSRFLETFSREDTEEWLEKPEDFRELFGGNHEEDFRIGLKFTRKTIKYFSGFYNSDIILSSPLGLFRAISSGGSKDEKKAPDADFLSSIEVMVVDHASALQMQNWQHVEFAFSQLNALPKESHGCDFSRVRHWYLDGLAKNLRQTIVFSSYLTPEINALVSTQLHNIAGRVKYVPTYNGAMLEVANTLPIPVSQTFVRFESRTPLKDSDARFKYFCASVLPQLARDKSGKGILLFVPNYADFARLRNHLNNSTDSTSISFGIISEYTSVKDTARARSYLLSGRNTVLMYTERAHHHFRYKIKGVQKVIFYGLPENPIFWTELVGLLGINKYLVDGSVGSGKGSVRAIFSKWDVLKLERVVGTERVGRLVSERSGDTFDFV